MTSYTRNRGYPYPSSEREAGNGGLHSELLARAVAEDLDGIDAGWAGLLQRPTLVLSIFADQTGLSNNALYSVFTDVVDKQVGTALESSGVGMRVAKGGDGWYHITGQLHSRAEGAITADAQHRMQLEHIIPQYGNLATYRMYYYESFQSGSLDMYTMGEAVVHLTYGQEIRMRFFHTNTGSTGRVVVAGTRLTGSLIVPDA